MAECAAVLHWLKMQNPAIPNAPIAKAAWQQQVRDILNINQWKQKLTRDLGVIQVVANGYGTREAACQAAFNLCPFA